MREIIHTVEVAAAPAAVDRALTTQDGLSAWWTREVREEDGLIRFTFEKDFNPVMRVEQHEPGKVVSWSTESGAEPWAGSTIRFELTEREEKTSLLFRHRYGSDLSDEVFGVFNFNWAYYLESLRLFCETGTGKSFTPPEG
jgi:uncharacterized protein YndB with AHSA1/START domain